MLSRCITHFGRVSRFGNQNASLNSASIHYSAAAVRLASVPYCHNITTAAVGLTSAPSHRGVTESAWRRHYHATSAHNQQWLRNRGGIQRQPLLPFWGKVAVGLAVPLIALTLGAISLIVIPIGALAVGWASRLAVAEAAKQLRIVQYVEVWAMHRLRAARVKAVLGDVALGPLVISEASQASVNGEPVVSFVRLVAPVVHATRGPCGIVTINATLRPAASGRGVGNDLASGRPSLRERWESLKQWAANEEASQRGRAAEVFSSSASQSSGVNIVEAVLKLPNGEEIDLTADNGFGGSGGGSGVVIDVESRRVD